MKLAFIMSERSTCRRLAVGCVITSADYRKVFAVGYNGNAAGLDNDCDSDEVGKCGCLHAEENAVISCDAARESSKVVFCTNLPCKMCAKRLINLGGVKKVIFQKPYRLVESVGILISCKIEVYRYTSIDGLQAKPTSKRITESVLKSKELIRIYDISNKVKLGLV
jgi:dCMP deaminase